MEFDNSNKKLSSEELIKIYEEYKPTTELMKLKFRDYGKDGIELLKKLHNLELMGEDSKNTDRGLLWQIRNSPIKPILPLDKKVEIEYYVIHVGLDSYEFWNDIFKNLNKNERS